MWRNWSEIMGFKKTITILLAVCMAASLAAITVNAASSSHGSHSYSSSISISNATGIIDGSAGNVYSEGTGSTGTATDSSSGLGGNDGEGGRFNTGGS